MAVVPYLLFVVLISPAAFAYIDNQILGVPAVLCEQNSLALDITTAQPFHGNIFVKGRARDSSCRQNYAINSSNSYSLILGNCGMQRLRTVNPRGVNFVVTLIVSFHPSGFITKSDRAFHVKCFYMERDTLVTASVKVSPLAPTELSDEVRMPTCEYSVRRDSIHGPQIKFANVGDTVFHVWECTGAPMGMLVKKCYVTDGEGEQHVVIDFDGCSADHYLLSELSYDEDVMRAHATSHVFKYADSNQLYFTCQIQLCHNTMGLCSGLTPPNCKDVHDRRRRAVERSERDQMADKALELDVSTDQMLIAGLDEVAQKTNTCSPSLLLILSPFFMFALFTALLSTIALIHKSSSKAPFCGKFANFSLCSSQPAQK